MKPRTKKYAVRRLQWRNCLIGMPVVLLCFVLPAQAQTDQILPWIGGPGGSQFVARCGQAELLTGFDLRTGDDVDAIRPLCVTVHGPAEAGPIEPYPSQFGGNGGGPRRLVCPDNAPFVIGLGIESEGVDTEIVNTIELYCGLAIADQISAKYPSAVFEGPRYVASPGTPFDIGGEEARRYYKQESCPAGTVSVGINGRYGVWLDAVGLVCGPLPATAQPQAPVDSVPGNAGKPPVTLGRVHVGGSHATPAPPPARMGDEPLICARARDARARKAPTASALEARCRAAGGSFTDRAVTPVRSGTGVISAPAGSRAGIFARAPAAPPAARPPVERPPVAPAERGTFMPPLLGDGARLWACANTAQGNAKGAACLGKKSGKAYCRMQGFSGALQQRADGAPGVAVGAVRAGTRVRATNGDACTANDCVAISELHCVP